MEENTQIHVHSISEAAQVTLNMINSIRIEIEDIPTLGMQLSTIAANVKMIRDAAKKMEEGPAENVDTAEPPTELEVVEDDQTGSPD